MKVGTWGGIGVYIHWTFWLLVVFYLVSVSDERGLAAGLSEAGFILCVFGCIALHEFGHAGAAAAYGIRTLDITLLPIGGVARLQRMPDKPSQELWIALAGPAVNFVIAAILFPVVILSDKSLSAPDGSAIELGFVTKVLAANLILAIFNLLPAFPMDGGRVVRSLLAMKLGNLRATEIAARGGRWMAFLFAVYGFWYSQYGLLLLALFVFIAGTAELFSVRARSLTGQSPDQNRTFVWQTGTWPPAQYGSNWPDASGSFSPRGFGEDVIDAADVREVEKGDDPPRLN